MRMVLLRHDLPDGSSHFDWMIEPPEPGRGLIAFRTQARIDRPSVTRFEAERIGEHRRVYLTYEGPVSGERGRVTRLATGQVSELIEHESTIQVRGELGECAGVWRGVLTSGLWLFDRQTSSV